MLCEKDKVLNTIASMIERSEKAWGKFPPGTSQYTLLKNRIGALKTAALLIGPGMSGDTVQIENDVLENALVPIESLISKSEKARQKLAQDSWQHTMLSDNLDALYAALPLIKKALDGKR